MENYIVLDGVTYDLVRRNEAKAENVGKVKLVDIPEGETFKLGEHEMIVLEQFEKTTAVIRKDLLVESKQFGESNNFDGSYVDRECSAFADEIERLVGKENLVEHIVDLTSDDGLEDYGTILRKASLLTAELYRRYVYELDKHKLNKWWWLATPWSTPTHDDEALCKCVSSSGRISYDYCNNDFGVRPLCILKSHIFVS